MPNRFSNDLKKNQDQCSYVHGHKCKLTAIFSLPYNYGIHTQISNRNYVSYCTLKMRWHDTNQNQHQIWLITYNLDLLVNCINANTLLVYNNNLIIIGIVIITRHFLEPMRKPNQSNHVINTSSCHFENQPLTLPFLIHFDPTPVV